MTEDTLEYFKKYRELVEARIALDEKIRQDREKLESVMKQSRSMEVEIEGMKKIMTYMIDTGMDPVEAKLKIEDQFFQSHWRRDYEIDSASSPLNPSMLQQGMIGAQGQSGNGWPTIPPGVNGATGSNGMTTTMPTAKSTKAFTRTGPIRGGI